MYTIGELAALGRVSVRMLRHYDAIGLVQPALVDHATGYRRYGDIQYARLIRVLAFKDLGFSLDEVKVLVDAGSDETLVREMLEGRRIALLESIEAHGERLARVEARLRSFGRNTTMNDIAFSALPPAVVARLSADVPAGGPDEVGPVIGPLFERLGAALTSTGVTPVGPPISYYEAGDGGDGLRVHAAFPVASGTVDDGEVEIVALPGAALAATTTHVGPMSGIGGAWQALHESIVAGGHVPDGAAREVYLRSVPLPQEEWVTQLQQPVRPR